MSDDLFQVAPKALQAQSSVLSPAGLQSRAASYDEQADRATKVVNTRMDALEKQRKDLFQRRTEDRERDASAFQSKSDDLISATEKGPDKVKMPDADLGPIIDPNDAKGFMFGMLAMTLVGAKGGRQHFDMALAGLDGALKGYKEGNLDRMKSKQAEFKRNFDLAIEKQRQATKQYEDVLKSKSLSLNQQMEMIRVHAAANEDAALQNAASMKDVERVYRQIDQYRGAASKLEAQAATLQDRIDARHEKASERAEAKREKAASSGADGWPPEAIEPVAQVVAAGGPVPAMGSGKGSNEARKQLWKRVGEIAKERGIAASDLPGVRAQFKADQSSLAALTKQNDAIESFEKTAVKNGDRLVSLAEKVDSTGVPVIERWIRAGRKEIAGDVDVSRFQAQLMLYGTEVAKILTNPSMGGVLSDSARHEVQEFLPANAALGQIKGLVSLLKQDFTNRRTSNNEQVDEVTYRLKNLGSRPGEGGAKTAAPAAGAQKNSKGWVLHTDANGNKAYVSPDGKEFEEVK